MHGGAALPLEVERKLEARIRPMLQVHGGDITLLSADEGDVRLRFEGACVGCPLRAVTFSVLIERELVAVEGVRSVMVPGVRISPHAAERLRAAFGDWLSGTGRPAGRPSIHDQAENWRRR